MDTLGRSESMNFVTSCHQVESTVLNANVEKVWENVKDLELNKLLPSHVKSVKFNTGSAHQVGSVFEVHYVDGSVWTNRIVEISESRRTISYELVKAEPAISFTSLLTVIRLYKVTDSDSTFLSWESDYSNDVNAHTVQDGKFKKLDYFKDFKKFFA